MTATDPALQQQLDDLARRLSAVEHALGLSPARAPSPSPTPPTVLMLPPAPAEPPAAPAPPARKSIPSHLGRTHPAPIRAPLPPQPHPDIPAAPATPSLDLERTIGAKWFAAIGAVVVVIGVALFLKLAYDRGWLDRIPPTGKVLTGAVFGLTLLGAGELARRRISPLASAGLSAAGVGALYASAYAAHGVYHLIGSVAALPLLAAASAIGIFVAARARLASVALLAILGAYLAPLILGGAAHPAVLPMYLLALLAVALWLAAWSPRPFHILRPVAWWATLLLGSAWIARTGLDHPAIALPFLAAVWAGVHTSLSNAARRGGIVPPEPGAPADALSWRSIRPIAGSFSTTAWCVILAATVLHAARDLPPWLAYAGGAAAAVSLASLLAGNLRVLRDVPRTDAQRLGAALAAQAGAMVIAAVAVGFQGGMEVVAWLALGAAAVAAGRWIGSRALDAYGLIVLTISAVRLLMLEWWATDAATGGTVFLGFYLTKWSLLVALAAAAWLATAALLRRGPNAAGRTVVPSPWRSGTVIAAIVVGLTLLALSPMHTRTHFASGATSLLALGAACAALAARLRSRAVIAYSTAVLSIILLITLARAPWPGFALNDPITRGPLVAGLLFSWWMYAMLLAAAASLVWAVCTLRATIDAWRPAALVGCGVAVAVLFAAFTHTWASGLAVTLVWTLLSLAVAAAHLALPRLSLNVFAALALMLTGVAWVPTSFGAPGGAGRWFTSATPIGLHPGLWTAAAIIAAGAAMLRYFRWLRAPGTSAVDPLPGALAGGLVMLALAATSAEAARLGGLISADPAARSAAVSVWWGLFAAGLLAVGFRARLPVVRHAGLGLLLSATAKAAIFDLASAPQEWRVASFIGLGLMMLGVAVVYSKISARVGSTPQTQSRTQTRSQSPSIFP